MRIAIEAQRIFRKNKHGMDFVALECIRQLQRIDRENEYFILVAPGEDRCLEGSERMHIVEVKCPTYPLWEQVALPLAVRRIKPDLLHCTSNTGPVWCPVPMVLTLHDIIFLEKRQSASKSLYQNMGWYYRRLVVPRILPKCLRIITVSRFERNRIKEALQLPDEKIVAIYNGFSDHFRPVEDSQSVAEKYLPDDAYHFFLGNTDPKKNTRGVLRAYALYVKESSAPLPLLIADLDERVIDGLLREERLEDLKPWLRFPGYIPNRDLPAVYSGASVFIYTSLRESFGIPLLEAMACGTPVITSDTSAMPEVAGSGALLIDPADPQTIASALLLLERDAQLYGQQVAYGLERVRRFSWEHTARELLDLYRSVVG